MGNSLDGLLLSRDWLLGRHNRQLFELGTSLQLQRVFDQFHSVCPSVSGVVLNCGRVEQQQLVRRRALLNREGFMAVAVVHTYLSVPVASEHSVRLSLVGDTLKKIYFFVVVPSVRTDERMEGRL